MIKKDEKGIKNKGQLEKRKQHKTFDRASYSFSQISTEKKI